MEKYTEIISAFPGCGKTECYLKYQNPEHEFVVLDSDSSMFDKLEFPENYIKHIIENIGKVDVIFISSHQVVRDALKKNLEIKKLIDDSKCHIILAYPSKDQKENYLERYKLRGSSEQFIKLLSDNWDNWIESMMFDNIGSKYLMSDTYLSDWVLSPHEILENTIKRRSEFDKKTEQEKDDWCRYCGCIGGCDLCKSFEKELKLLSEYKSRICNGN